MRKTLVALFVVCLASAALADQGPKLPCPADGKVLVTGLDLPADPEHPRVRSSVARLGDTVTVWVCNLDKLLDAAAANGKTVTLFLNGKDSAIEPTLIARERGRLDFRLERNDNNKDLWRAFLRSPFLGNDPQIFAGVGPSGGAPVPGNVFAAKDKLPRRADMTFFLDQMRLEGAGRFWIILLGSALIGFFVAAWKTAIVRDGPDFEDLNKKTQKQPYSLARCQMAWWLFLILIGYVVIWLISGNRDTITPSLLGLMGISAATALGSVAVSSASEARVSATRARLTNEQLSLQTSIAGAQQALAAVNAAAANPPSPADQKRQLELNQEIAAYQSRLDEVSRRLRIPAGPQATDGFFRDVLSDETGAVALHRFQIFLWTIVLGIIFGTSVLHELTMPEFSATLLGLMGISAGTYIGFKFPQSS